MRLIARRLLLPLALFCVIGCGAVPVPLRAMTYNIRTATPKDGPHQWEFRRDAMGQMLRAQKPDLVGMQEVRPEQLRDLEQRLPGYAHVGSGREGGHKGEHNPIFYNKLRFKLLDSGTFWLAPDTSRPALGWDARYPRICTWARLRDLRSRRTIAIVNTHLDHAGREAQLEGAKLARRRLAEMGDLPGLLTGDFNVRPTKPPYMAVITSGLHDARLIAVQGHTGTPGTYAGFPDAARTGPPAVLDYIFVTPHWTVRRTETLPRDWDGRPLSDHCALIADIK